MKYTFITLLLASLLSLYQNNQDIYDSKNTLNENKPSQSSSLSNIQTEYSTQYVPIANCRVSGVYNQLCLKKHIQRREENDTKYRHYFNCFSKAICGYHKGKCQWLKTKQFNKCIIKAKQLSAHSEIRTVSNQLANPSSFSTNPVVALSDPLNDNRSIGRTFAGTNHKIIPRELLLKTH